MDLRPGEFIVTIRGLHPSGLEVSYQHSFAIDVWTAAEVRAYARRVQDVAENHARGAAPVPTRVVAPTPAPVEASHIPDRDELLAHFARSAEPLKVRDMVIAGPGQVDKVLELLRYAETLEAARKPKPIPVGPEPDWCICAEPIDDHGPQGNCWKCGRQRKQFTSHAGRRWP